MQLLCLGTTFSFRACRLHYLYLCVENLNRDFITDKKRQEQRTNCSNVAVGVDMVLVRWLLGNKQPCRPNFVTAYPLSKTQVVQLFIGLEFISDGETNGWFCSQYMYSHLSPLWHHLLFRRDWVAGTYSTKHILDVLQEMMLVFIACLLVNILQEVSADQAEGTHFGWKSVYSFF
jgi:hypothetical protein